MTGTAPRHGRPTRRSLLAGIVAGAAAASVRMLPALADETAPPEVRTIHLTFDPRVPVLCYAPQYLAEAFLRIEGFTDVRYVPYGVGVESDSGMLVNDLADFAAGYACDHMVAIDRGEPVTLMAGLHPGCVELFASDGVASIKDLAGRRILTGGRQSPAHLFLSTVLAHVGLDPDKDVEWVLADFLSRPRMLAAGKADVLFASPPLNFRIRREGLGHVILNTTLDDPWRHFFCCMIAARSDFVRENPVATKRAMRAFVKANQLCDINRGLAASRLVERGAIASTEDARTMLDEVPYGAWRTFDPRDTVRFFALRLYEAGLIGSTPTEILARGADFSFLEELKRELKT